MSMPIGLYQKPQMCNSNRMFVNFNARRHGMPDFYNKKKLGLLSNHKTGLSFCNRHS
jgi:hypothetical protein